MSARAWKNSPPAAERCSCGSIPGSRSQIAGDVTTYWVRCTCGRETEPAESMADAVFDWNEGNILPGFFPSIAAN